MTLARKLRSKIKNFVFEFPVLHDAAMSLQSREKVFAQAYATQAWGSAECGSGIGSELAATTWLRSYLPEFFERLDVQTLLDAPCGDWNWMRLVDLGRVDYVGVDIVPGVIGNNQANYARAGVHFAVADITKDELPRADLVLCRACWIHLSFRDIAAVLENLRRTGATWLLASNSPRVRINRNQLTGLPWRHLNLQRAPFHFPPPLEARDADDRHLPGVALWRMADLPSVEV